MESSILSLLTHAAVIAVIVGACVVELSVRKGRKALRPGNAIAGGVGLVAGFLFWGETLGLNLLAGVASGGFTWLFATLYSGFVSGEIDRQLAIASEVASFALGNFERLNPDVNGDLTCGGLNKLIFEDGKLSPRELDIVVHLSSKMEDIGHATGRFAVSLPPGRGDDQFRNRYGCSREDLRTYEERVRDKYFGWV